MTGTPASIFPLGPDFAGRHYALLGLARSGLATVAALTAAGAEVVAWDDRAEARAAGAALGATIAELDDRLAGKDALILSPGVPLNTHPLATAARAAGVPIVGDVELFAQARKHLPPHKVVGITGTNGKSTTTALVHHILKTAGVPTLMGGNIGLPILSREPLPEGGVYVLELSSYQIDLTFSLDCDEAVLLNVTPDHLDRYNGDFRAYVHSKARLFEMQTAEGVSVVRAADWFGWNWGNDPFVCHMSNARAVDLYDDAFHTFQSEPGAIAIYEQGEWPSLQGPHNLENMSAAMSVCYGLGLDGHQIRAGLRTYPGLPHRMERIATVNGVLFVNDSKATNPEAAAPALAAYTNIHWILGGLAKGATLGDCARHFGNVTRAYLIGTAAADFARAIGDAIPTSFSGDLATALSQAAANAKSGDVVLLSPAAASFDQFRDFEARGDAFRDWVHAYQAGGQK